MGRWLLLLLLLSHIWSSIIELLLLWLLLRRRRRIWLLFSPYRSLLRILLIILVAGIVPHRFRLRRLPPDRSPDIVVPIRVTHQLVGLVLHWAWAGLIRIHLVVLLSRRWRSFVLHFFPGELSISGLVDRLRSARW